MGTTSAGHVGSGRRPAPRLVLRMLLLAATVLVGFGLATMHTLLVPTAAAAPTTAPAVVLEPGPAPEPTSAHPAPAVHHDAGEPGGATCAHCTDHHLGAAAACLAALLLTLLVLAAPRLAPPWLHHRARAGRAFRPLPRTLPRAPSLHVLVVSRT